MECISWNPFETYRNWRRRREDEYIVEINRPRMKIKGKIAEALVRPRFKYVAFRGIPYALPPLRWLRFQPPQEYPELKAGQPIPVVKAYTTPKCCIQETHYGVTGSEDCLYLNVFTPKKPKDIPELLPVLVYIHGGGFSRGEGGHVNPEGILREDLIVVTINYRLGIFGFLNMRAENCRGNAGMKDQVMALQWVKRNIKKFKGDPANVTICGQSAGGSSVNFHMISPLSKGLFHKAIVMSGGVYCPWGFGGSVKRVKQLFKQKMKKENELRTAVVEVLQKMTTKRLLRLGCKVMKTAWKFEAESMTVSFCPTVEYIEAGAFLPETVENLMKTAQAVPTIAGITEQEGYQHFRFDPIRSIEASQNDDALKRILRVNFCWKDPTAIDRHFAAIKSLYFRNAENTDEEEKKHQYASLVTDIYFRRFYDNFKIGNLMNTGRPPFYVYQFDYFKGKPIFPMSILSDGQTVITPIAAEHSDDFNYLFLPEFLLEWYFLIPQESRLLRREIERVKTNLCNLWGSFCKTGVPKSRLRGDSHVNWLEHTEQDPHYLHISANLSLERGRLNEERWAELNAICQLESTIPSLAETPKTPNLELVLFPLIDLESDPSSSETEVDLLDLESDTLSSETELIDLGPYPSTLGTSRRVIIHLEPQPSLSETSEDEIHPEPQPKSFVTVVDIHPEPQPKSLETAVEQSHLEPDLFSFKTVVEIHPEPVPSSFKTVVEVHAEPDPPPLETAIEVLHPESEPSSPEIGVESLHLESEPSSPESAIKLLYYLESEPSSPETAVKLLYPESEPSSPETAVKLLYLEPDSLSPERAVELLHVESEPSSPETEVEMLHPEPDPPSSETAGEKVGSLETQV